MTGVSVGREEVWAGREEVRTGRGKYGQEQRRCGQEGSVGRKEEVRTGREEVRAEREEVWAGGNSGSTSETPAYHLSSCNALCTDVSGKQIFHSDIIRSLIGSDLGCMVVLNLPSA